MIVKFLDNPINGNICKYKEVNINIYQIKDIRIEELANGTIVYWMTYLNNGMYMYMITEDSYKEISSKFKDLNL